MTKPQPSPAPAPSFLPDPGHLWMIFRRRIGIFAIALLVVLGLTAAWLVTQPTTYGSTASILIVPRQPQVVVDENPLSPEMVPDTNVIDTEVQILSSARLAGRVAEALDLEQYEEFGDGQTPASSVGTAEPGTHPLAGALLRHVSVRRSGLTYLIDIHATAQDAALSAAIANGFAQQYLAQQQDVKGRTVEDASEFLEGRLVELRLQASEADAALQNYKIREGLMSAEGATMAEQEVSVLNQEISTARASLAEKVGQLSAARSRVTRGGGGAEVPAALQSGTVAELRRREVELTGTLASYRERFGPRHPEVLRAEQELGDVRGQIQNQIDRVLSSLESDVVAARSRLASLEASQRGAQSSLAGNSSAQVGLLELERNAEAARSIYETFLERAQQISSQEGLVRPDASIETLARVPSSPSSPNYPLTMTIGAIAALIAGFGAIGAAEYFDARVRTRRDVEDKLDLAYLGAIPDPATIAGSNAKGTSPADYFLDHPHSAFAEAVRAVKNAVMFGRFPPPQSIAVTSALPREGKSTTALCLARAFAQSGKRTVLLDCDARRHAVSDWLLEDGARGLEAYLAGNTPLSAAMATDPRTDLKVLGTKGTASAGTEMFAHTSFDSLLSELGSSFDMIVVDTAPILGIAETRAIASQCDAVILLGRWRSTAIKAIGTAVDLLRQTGTAIDGLALTNVDVREYASTGQQDVYGYAGEFADYYAN